MHAKQDKPQNAVEVLKFFDWSFKNGQKMADELDYVPMPEAVVKEITDDWRGGDGRRRQAALELTRRQSHRPSTQPSCRPLGPAGIARSRPVFFQEGLIMPSISATLDSRHALPADATRRARADPAARCAATPRCRMRCSATTRFFALLVFCCCSRSSSRCLIAAVLAMEKFGFAFFVTDDWDPVTKKFGALAPIYGTLVTSAIALLIACR